MSLQSAQSLDIADLRLVAAIGAGGSLSSAARHLGVDHSTAFRRLNQIEMRSGARLFERGRDGYAPTAAGEEAIAVAVRVLGELNDLDRKLAGRDLRPSGTVRITTTDTLAELLLPMMPEFRRAHPGIIVELVLSNAFFTLARRDADIAIRPSEDAPDYLVARSLAKIVFAPYASRDYMASRAGSSLASLDWLAPDDTLAHIRAARWLSSTIPDDRIIFRTSALTALAAAARAGLGAAPLPCFLGDPDASLMRLSEPIQEPGGTLWLLTHPDLRRATRIRACIDFFAPRLRAMRDLFEGRV